MQAANAAIADRPTPRQTHGVARRITAGAPQAVARFSDPELLGAGQIILLSLDAIADRLGSEWQGRRTEVYDRAKRVLSRRVPKDAFLRVSETDFLVAQPDVEAAPAEETALRFLNDIVSHFIGEASNDDLYLFRVKSISSDRAVCAALNPAEIMARSNARVLRADDSPTDPGRLSSDPSAPFVTGDGRRVRPSCVLEPVFELSGNVRIGYRLKRQVIDVETGVLLSPAQQRNLSRADILRIDMATIARGMARLKSMAEGQPELSLILPVSFFSLTHPEGGRALAQAFTQARQAVKAGVICEVCDIEDVQKAALSAAIGMVKPCSLFVVGHLTDENPRASLAMKTAGVQVVSFTCPDNIASDAEFIGWLRAALRSARRIGPSTMVYGCNSPRRLAMAGLLGASHASLSGRH